MLRATIKSLLSYKLRLLLSGFAILLSVMFISATFVFTDTVDASFDQVVDTVVADIDVVVAPAPDDQEPAIPASAVDIIRMTPGVGSVTPSIALHDTNRLRIVGRDGKLYPGKDHSQLVGNWTGEPGELTGRRPVADDEVVISETLARTGPFARGDRVTLRDAAHQVVTFTVVGVFKPGAGTGAQRTLGVYLTDPAAQRLLMAGKPAYQDVRVKAAATTSEVTLRDRLRASLGSGYQIETGRDAMAEQLESIEEALSMLRYVLLGFVGFALFIGVFLIFNTFSIIVAQRLRELALLRALGASRAQLRRSVLLEAVVTATIGSAIGFALGCGLGWLGARFAASASASIEIGTVAITPLAVVISFAVGVLVTVVAALVPAARAARIPPVAALRAAEAPDRPVRRLTIAGLLAGTGGIATMLYSATRSGVNDRWVLLVFVGALLVLVGLALLTPFLTRPLGAVIGRAFAWSVPGRLGRLNAGRKPRRTAITAAAMMIGVAVVAMFGTGFASSSAEVGEDLESSFHADLVMRPTWDVDGVLGQDLVDRVAALHGVSGVVALGAFDSKIEGWGDSGWVSWYSDGEAARRLLSLRAERGRIDGLRPGEVVLASRAAKTTKAEVGDKIKIRSGDHTEATYQVVGILTDNPMLYDYHIAASDPMAIWARAQNKWQYEQVYVDAAPGDAAEVRAAIDAMLADEPEVTVQTRERFIAGLADNNDTGMILLQVMMALALLIAALGVVNTMVLSVIERTRELGMLRTIGLSRRQTIRMISVEAIVVSVLGAVLGVVAGVGLAFVIQKAQGALVVVPWPTLAAYLIGAVVVGLVAAIGPALRAVRLNPLTAVGYE